VLLKVVNIENASLPLLYLIIGKLRFSNIEVVCMYNTKQIILKYAL